MWGVMTTPLDSSKPKRNAKIPLVNPSNFYILSLEQDNKVKGRMPFNKETLWKTSFPSGINLSLYFQSIPRTTSVAKYVSLFKSHVCIFPPLNSSHVKLRKSLIWIFYRHRLANIVVLKCNFHWIAVILLKE